MWGAGIMIAPIVGPTIGAWLTDNLNWRWVFYINVPGRHRSPSSASSSSCRKP